MRAEWRGVGSVRTCTVATNALVLAQKLPPSSLSFPRVLVAFEVAVGSTTPRVGGLWARRKRTEGNASPARINKITSLPKFYMSTTDPAMPANATNCLHTALTLMGSLGTGAPAFADYVKRSPPNPKLLLQDVMRAWVLANPALAATIGLPLPQ